MPEQNTPGTPHVPNEGADPISESENLLNELKKMVGDAADASADEAAGAVEGAASVAVDTAESAKAAVPPAAPADAPEAPAASVVETFGTPENPVAPAAYTAPTAPEAPATPAIPEAPADPNVGQTPIIDGSPEKPKRKMGPIIGIVIAALAALALLAYGLTHFNSCSVGGDQAQISNAVTSAMSELTDPSAEDKAELAEGISDGFEITAGFNLEDLGITSEEYADWVLDNISYEVTESAVDESGESAFATVKVQSRDMEAFNQNFESEIVKMSEGGLADVDTYEALYQKIGEAMKTAMDATDSAESEVTLELSKADGEWVVNDDSKEACFSKILAGTE